jgi:outer membrane protein assembly factor BamC
LGKQQQAGTPVLPAQDALKFERDHDKAWLVVQGDPQEVWPRAREFWAENGFFILSENPELGILQTDWVETRPDVPKGALRSLISRVYETAYSSSYRDRYRMRLERGEQPGTTELYITQQGIEEIVVAGENDIGDTKWGPRPPDPGLESEMLKRMMIFLGVKPEKAQALVAAPPPQRARAELVQQDDGQASLVVHKDFARAWRDVGIVLDRVGFAVEDRNRLEGLYYVRYSDPQKIRDKGFLSKLAFWSDDDQEVDHYQIKLSDDGTDTRVVVLNTEGGPEISPTAVRILNVLYDDLK